MTSNLYADFHLTIENCHQEPIHRPLAIQGHGHLFVFDRSQPSKLYAANRASADWLGTPQHRLWNEPIACWLPADLRELCSHLQQKDAGVPMAPISHSRNGQTHTVIAHDFQGYNFLELEPAGDTSVPFEGLRYAIDRMRACSDVQSLLAATVHLVKGLLGFDRVMIYQFDPDFHGSVIAEAKEEHLEPFLGLHYPATDIPPLARDLFLRNRSRSIIDICLPNDDSLFNPALGPKPPMLDLSMCQLRATSPMHIEYLVNMGVRATLSLAVIVHGKLWGLFACHHYAPRSLPYDLRKMGETIGDCFSLRLSELVREQADQKRLVSQDSEQKFLDRIRVDDHYKIELAESSESLQGIINADGAAVVTTDSVSSMCGSTPTVKELLAIRDWLSALESNEVFVTDNLTQDVPCAAKLAQPLGGMLAACVSEISGSYLFWFRLPQRQITDWAGDPSKSLEVVSIPNSDETRLSPRTSFKKWQEAIEDRSVPWETVELEMVDRIRNTILKKEFQRTATIVMRNRQEFMQLIYAASHDLQEPLRTQLNYLDLLQEELVDTAHADWLRYVGRASGAVQRMQALISDLLDYASLGTETKREPLNLNAIIEEVRDDLTQVINEKAASIEVGRLPKVKAAPAEMKQLFQNLLSNALKYVKVGTAPHIKIDHKREDHFVVFSIKDNGIGIEPIHFQKIFLMFQRLHGKEQFEGTGIGLALCQKIVENYDGKIWVTSSLGNGSTFWLKFHDSILA